MLIRIDRQTQPCDTVLSASIVNGVQPVHVFEIPRKTGSNSRDCIQLRGWQRHHVCASSFPLRCRGTCETPGATRVRGVRQHRTQPDELHQSMGTMSGRAVAPHVKREALLAHAVVE
jgi:hypothetical protein